MTTPPSSPAALRAAETYLREIDGDDFGTPEGHSISDLAAIIDRETYVREMHSLILDLSNQQTHAIGSSCRDKGLCITEYCWPCRSCELLSKLPESPTEPTK